MYSPLSFKMSTMILRNFLYVMLGGAVGAALRYAVGLLCSSVRVLNLPVGTLVVNLIGCLLLGLLVGVGQKYISFSGTEPMGLMLTVGLCGAFTTFSTFSAETIRAMENGQVGQSLVYVLVSVVGGLLLFWVGKMMIMK